MRKFLWSLTVFLGLCVAVAYGNYTATQGAGTTFGSIVVSTVHYAQMLFCDPVTPANCVTTQTANSHTSFDAVINDASGNRLSGLVTGTFGTPSTQVLSIQNNDPCSYAAKSSVAISLTSATTTQLVALSGTTVVYVCGFSVTIAPSATTADTLLFEYGTGASCGTGTTAITGTYGNGDLTSAAPVVPVTYGGAGIIVFTAPSGKALCALSAGTAVNIQGVLTYVQQ